MNYYKNVNDGFIDSIQETEAVINFDGKIEKAEYNEIVSAFESAPSAPEGFVYRLKTDLTWELCELPPDPEPTNEINAEELLSLLEAIL